MSGRHAAGRLYAYVGPATVKARVAGGFPGRRISSTADLLAWASGTGRRPGPDGLVVATFVLDAECELLLADRRSEHVACAGGRPVLSAGEVFFRLESNAVEVVEVRNQSTGFRPEPESWPAVAGGRRRVGPYRRGPSGSVHD